MPSGLIASLGIIAGCTMPGPLSCRCEGTSRVRKRANQTFDQQFTRKSVQGFRNETITFADLPFILQVGTAPEFPPNSSQRELEKLSAFSANTSLSLNAAVDLSANLRYEGSSRNVLTFSSISPGGWIRDSSHKRWIRWQDCVFSC